MKVLLKKDFTWEADEGVFKTIGSGTVVTGSTAKQALADGVGEEIPDNQPNFNPLPAQGVAAAPFNVNGEAVDPVADQYVGQGAADDTTGTTEAGTAPAEGSPTAAGTVGLTDEQVKERKSSLKDQLSNATTDAEKASIQAQLDAMDAPKAKSAPANKAKPALKNK